MTTASKPCQQAGEPARNVAFKGNRRCAQKRDMNGIFVNHGFYEEWYPNGKIALEGFYRMGKKDGHWIEYGPDGNKVSDQVFDNGFEINEKKRQP